MATRESGKPADVVRLPGEGPPPEAADRPTPPGRLHGLAIASMGTSALVGIAAVLAFITISWPGNSGRWAIAVFLIAGVIFLVSASTAVFSAARDTYKNGDARTDARTDD